MTRTPNQIAVVRLLIEATIDKRGLPPVLATYAADQMERELWAAVEREILLSTN